jgi:hypothetical protein
VIQLVRRYFHKYANDKHYNRRWEKDMGGYTRGEESQRHTVQDSIDSLNAAIDRLDGIIKEMQEQTKDGCCK